MRLIPLCIIVFFVGFVTGLWTCSRQEHIVQYKTVKDTITVALPPVVVEKEHIPPSIQWKDRYITVKDLPDSIASIIRMKDSLIHSLITKDISMSFALDTILGNGDTVNVECEELRRNILLQYRPAPRLVEVEYKTIEIKKNPLVSIGLGGGYGMMTDGGGLRSSVGVFVIWNIFSL